MKPVAYNPQELDRNPYVPYLGSGAGLRRVHHDHILAERPEIEWFEVLTENYLNRGGAIRKDLLDIASHYKIVTHGVAMSVGSTDPLDWGHLKRVKQLNTDVGALWTSEHLCFSTVNHANLSGLVPLPFTREVVKHVSERVRIIQDFFELPFLLENVTYYMVVSDREMSEVEFTNEIIEQADCGLLLDVNNVYINSRNHGFDAGEFIRALPAQRIGQIHLAGHDEGVDLIKDTHDCPVSEAVWALYRTTLEHAGLVTTNIEWDSEIPDWPGLWDETEATRRVLAEYGG